MGSGGMEVAREQIAPDLDQRYAAAMDTLGEVLDTTEFEQHYLQPGGCSVMDNHAVLHNRTKLSRDGGDRLLKCIRVLRSKASRPISFPI